MSWLNKFIGGAIGFTVGGPIGAIIGYMAGSYLGKNTKLSANNIEKQKMITFIAIFSLAAKIAKADGIVSKEEIATLDSLINNQFQMNNEERKLAINAFSTAKNSSQNIEEIAQQFYQMTPNANELHESVLEILVIIANADGKFHSAEEKELNKVKNIFHISNYKYAEMQKIHCINSKQIDEDKYYAILGCKPEDSLTEIKLKYRKLASQYHPDKIISKGLPEEFMLFAKKKFQEIQEAYEYIALQKTKKVS